jgi:hypothetical protein
MNVWSAVSSSLKKILAESQTFPSKVSYKINTTYRALIYSECSSSGSKKKTHENFEYRSVPWVSPEVGEYLGNKDPIDETRDCKAHENRTEGAVDTQPGR